MSEDDFAVLPTLVSVPVLKFEVSSSILASPLTSLITISNCASSVLSIAHLFNDVSFLVSDVFNIKCSSVAFQVLSNEFQVNLPSDFINGWFQLQSMFLLLKNTI